MLNNRQASHCEEKQSDSNVRHRAARKKELEELGPPGHAGLGCGVSQLGLEHGARASGARQLWIERAAMHAHEIGDRGFEFREARAAEPAGSQMRANPPGAAAGKLAICGVQEVLVRYVEFFICHNAILFPRFPGAPENA